MLNIILKTKICLDQMTELPYLDKFGIWKLPSRVSKFSMLIDLVSEKWISKIVNIFRSKVTLQQWIVS